MMKRPVLPELLTERQKADLAINDARVKKVMEEDERIEKRKREIAE